MRDNTSPTASNELILEKKEFKKNKTRCEKRIIEWLLMQKILETEFLTLLPEIKKQRVEQITRLSEKKMSHIELHNQRLQLIVLRNGDKSMSAPPVINMVLCILDEVSNFFERKKRVEPSPYIRSIFSMYQSHPASLLENYPDYFISYLISCAQNVLNSPPAAQIEAISTPTEFSSSQSTQARTFSNRSPVSDHSNKTPAQSQPNSPLIPQLEAALLLSTNSHCH